VARGYGLASTEAVIADFGDVPYRTITHWEPEALMAEPLPTWNGKLLTISTGKFS
jgi:hypothetical protein